MSAPALLERNASDVFESHEFISDGDGAPNDVLTEREPVEIPEETVLSAIGGSMVLLDTLILWLVLGTLLQFGLSLVLTRAGLGLGYLFAGLGLLAFDWGTAATRTRSKSEVSR